VNVPANVTIASGATSATFSATAGSVTSNQTAVLTASYNGSAQTTVTVTAHAQVTSLSCSPSTIGSGTSSNCSVTLSGAASGNAVVALASNNAAVTVPANVSVASGATFATFSAAAGSVTTSQPVVITASYNGSVQTTVTVTGPGQVSSVSCSPSTIAKGAVARCSITLSSPASGSTVVALSSSNAAVIVPANVTVVPGASTATFPATGMAAGQTAVLTASENGTAQTTVTVTAAAPTISLSCNPSTIASGAASTCSITLGSPSSGSSVVALSSGNGAVSVPTSATVASGASSATFLATAGTVTSSQTAVITASYNGSSAQTTVAVTAVAQITSLTCSPSTINAGANTNCSVALGGPAALNTTVALSSGNAAVVVPASVLIVAGQSNGSFTASASAGASGSASISASLDGITVSTTVSVSVGGPAVSSISCSPSVIDAPGTSQCTVTLNGPAGPSGFTASLSSDNATASVPSSVQVPAGASVGTFVAAVSAAAVDGSAVITATSNGFISTTLGYRTAFGVKSMVCSPNIVPAHSTANCSVTLNHPPASQQVVYLTSSSTSLTIPNFLLIGPSQSLAPFVAASGTPTQQETVVITASAQGQTMSALLSLTPTPAQITIVAPALIAAEPGDQVHFQVAATSPQGLPVSIAIANQPAGAVFDPVQRSFSWTPLLNQMGDAVITFTATDSSGATASTAVKVRVGNSRVAVASALNSASLSTASVCSPGSLATIFGVGFTTQDPAPASQIPLPTQVAGVQVLANGQALPLLYASSTQVNFQCPLSAAGSDLTISIQAEDGTTIDAFQGTMAEATPGVYSLDESGAGQGVVFIANAGMLAMPVAAGYAGRPVHQGEYLTIWVNGLGPVSGTAPVPGTPAPSDQLLTTQDAAVTVLGGTQLTPLFSGIAPSLIGTYQLNVQVPMDAPIGSAIPIYVQVTLSDGTVVKSNLVTIAVDKAPPA
jgi:trimeric autotransporter adhesin